MHYDHDLNFQILMRGTKRWRMQANAHIETPLESHHILTAPKDELYAHMLPLPREFSDPISLVMEPGSCLFFPAGCWHEVESVGPTFAVNIVIDPPRMHEIVAKALENVLAANSRYRGFALGMLGDGSPPLLQAHAMEEFERVRKACLEALESIGPEDASVALEEGRYRWSSEHAERRLETAEDDAVRVSSSTGRHFELDHRFRPLLERLVRVQGSFDLPQLCASAPQVRAEEMLAVVLDLVGRGFLERDTT